MNVLVPLPIVLPLLGAAVSLLLQGHRRAQRLLGLAVCVATMAIAVVLLVTVDRVGVVAVQPGGWPAPGGITLVVDRFSAIMLVVSTVMVLGVLVYAIGQLDAERERLYFHPVYLVLNAGVSASFLTGDLFNLFVAFEVMLMASYVLITLGASGGQVRSGMTYLVINLVASAMFVAAVGLTYAATGSVNLADLAGRLAETPAPLRDAIGLLLLCVFGVKAAIFPLFFWLPDSYPTAPTPITALFAGLLTKVGVYAIFRTQTLLFAADGPSPLLLTLAGATMFVGVLGAIAQNDIKRILSFHIVSQIGYMVFGLGLFSVAGLAAGIFYIVHHIIVKTSLFLVGGMIESATGTGALDRLSGLARRAPAMAALFLLVALSLAGLPPFSGFLAKLALVQEGLALGRPFIVGVSLLVSLLTLFSMTKIWSGAFWGEPGASGAEPALAPIAGGAGTQAPPSVGGGGPVARLAMPGTMTGATVALVGLSLLVAVGAHPLYELCVRAATDLADPAAYVTAVLG